MSASVKNVRRVLITLLSKGEAIEACNRRGIQANGMKLKDVYETLANNWGTDLDSIVEQYVGRARHNTF